MLQFFSLISDDLDGGGGVQMFTILTDYPFLDQF